MFVLQQGNWGLFKMALSFGIVLSLDFSEPVLAMAAQPRVAVLVQPGLPVFGKTQALSAARIVRELNARGIAAEELDAARLGNPNVFNAKRYDALVMAYRNCFPLAAFENIRAFHRAGGCLVMNGCPFCHPCEPPKTGAAKGQKKSAVTEWTDLDNDNRFYAHDEFGLGAGGFAGPTPEGASFQVVEDNPLGLRPEHLSNPLSRVQFLRAESLAKEDKVLPLVIEKGAGQPAAALIQHNCQSFHGARDAWLGRVEGGENEAAHYAAVQLFTRAVAWCLREKGAMGEKDFAGVLARLDQEKPPAPLPDKIEAVKEPRPWGETFYPKSPEPARRMLVVDVGPLAPEQRLAVVCLQGLLARRQPRLWLNFTEKNQTLLQWQKDGGFIDAWETVADWRGLFRQFAGEFKGAVAPDPALYQGVLLACNVAACEDLIVASPELAKELGLPVKVDLRGRFPKYADGLRWVWETYRDRLNHHVCMSLNPAHASNGSLSYDIEMRSLIFWVSGSGDGDRPGADSFAERRIMAEIFSQLPPNIGIRGYPGAGDAGLLEGPGVRFFSEYGKVLTPTDHVANVCAMSGARVGRLEQPAKVPPPAVEKDKVYIAMTMSDGDNLGTWAGYFGPYFEHPAHGRFPIGWGMGPAILDLMPGVAAWYFGRAKPGDEFLCDVSGIGYYNTSVYADRYREPAKIYDDLMGWTGRYMQRLGMETIRALGGENSKAREAIRLDAMARDLPFCHSFFPDYARHVDSYDEAVFALPDGRPVFRALTKWKYGKDGLLRDIREQVGGQRPAFVNAFLHNWTFTMDALESAFDRRDAHMVFVSPSQLAALYREAREKGWVGPAATTHP